MTTTTVLVPEHTRALRLKQFVKNIRETAKYHHEIIVILDRPDFPIEFDFDPSLTDPELVEYAKSEGLDLHPSPEFLDKSVDEVPSEVRARAFTMRKWIEWQRDYFEKYDVRIEECPLSYEIKGVFNQYPLPTCAPASGNLMLKHLRGWDFGADVVINYCFEALDFESDWVYVCDDDMIYLFKNWDERLLEHVDESRAFTCVFQPKVFNVRPAEPHEEVGLVKGWNMYEIRQPREKAFLDVDLVRQCVEAVNREREEKGWITEEICGLRKEGGALPILIHRDLWNLVGGRDYLLSKEDDGLFPGRFIGGSEVWFDFKLGEAGVIKRVVWASQVFHTKLPFLDGRSCYIL